MMPFIEKKHRPNMDILVRRMVALEVKADGDLNYVLFKFCKFHVEPGYGNYKKFIGELNECAAMIRKEILIPYEMEKKKINGDVL